MKKRVIYAALIIVAVSIGIISCMQLFKSNNAKDQIPRKAAVIDNLAITNPNSTFFEEVKRVLLDANFSNEDIDYYGYEKVTVNFYRELPKLGYGLIILRVHSGMVNDVDVCFYTSERITEDALAHYLNQGYEIVNSTLPQTGENYFGISSEFAKSNMEGRFENTVIIAMGCNSYKTESMAKALVNDRGAKLYIGWNSAVFPLHTDVQTIRLLELLFKNKTVADAVDAIERDPISQGRLRYYPLELADFRVTNLIKSSISPMKNMRYQDISLIKTQNQVKSPRRKHSFCFSPYFSVFEKRKIADL
jgi:hypothetical protein